MEMNIKNQILDLIILLLKINHKAFGKKSYQCVYNNKTYTLNSVTYLLDQTIRQYEIPRDHYCSTEEAIKMWKHYGLTINALFGFNSTGNPLFGYKEKITLKQKENVPIYIGSKKEPVIKCVDTFCYNDVFHNEHIVPVKMIIDELLNLTDSELTYQNVENILNKIYICKMLKKEDRKIGRSSRRCSTNYQDVISNEYKKAGINVLWEKDIQKK